MVVHGRKSIPEQILLVLVMISAVASRNGEVGWGIQGGTVGPFAGFSGSSPQITYPLEVIRITDES